MQWFLVGEWLFVGQDVTDLDAMKFVSHGDAEGLSANITNNAKEVHLYLVGGEGLPQLPHLTLHTPTPYFPHSI